MNEDTMKQYALPMIAIGVILMIAGGYQAFNPVLAVSAHDDRADVQRMLAITTFTVEGFNPTVTMTGTPSGSILEGTLIDITCTWDYDGYPQPAAVHLVHKNPLQWTTAPITCGDTGSYTFSTPIPLINGPPGTSQFCCIIDAWGQRDLGDGEPDPVAETCNAYTIQDTPIPPAQIDDATDTLTVYGILSTGEMVSQSTFRPGDRVMFSADGTNIGGQVWEGTVEYYVTPPGESPFLLSYPGVRVQVGETYTSYSADIYTLPADAAEGVYTIQTKWVDDDGAVHAMSAVDFGTETIWGIDISMLGALIALIGLLIVGYGLAKRKS